MRCSAFTRSNPTDQVGLVLQHLCGMEGALLAREPLYNDPGILINENRHVIKCLGDSVLRLHPHRSLSEAEVPMRVKPEHWNPCYLFFFFNDEHILPFLLHVVLFPGKLLAVFL